MCGGAACLEGLSGGGHLHAECRRFKFPTVFFLFLFFADRAHPGIALTGECSNGVHLKRWPAALRRGDAAGWRAVQPDGRRSRNRSLKHLRSKSLADVVCPDFLSCLEHEFIFQCKLTIFFTKFA